VKALLAGLDLPASDPARRSHWQALLAREGVEGLRQALAGLAAAHRLPPGERDNPRRLLRALEAAESAAPAPTAWRDRAWPTIVGLRLPRAELHRRIEARVARMYAGGLIAEAVALRARHGGLSPTAAQAIGYAEALACHDGLIDLQEAMVRTATRTRQLAKRQETWFRHQLAVHWIDIEDGTQVAEIAGRVLQAWREYGPARTHA
jgi:tRNA dimethylallyltransferase